jgi:hypothetical protein
MSEFKYFWGAMRPAEKQALADQLETSKVYMSQIAHGHRKPSKFLRQLINIYTRQVNVFVNDETHDN